MSEPGYIRIFVGDAVHWVAVQPREFVDVKVVGDDVEVKRTPDNEALLAPVKR